jgi:hypothetical protein
MRYESRASAVGIVTRYGLDESRYSLVEIGFGAHPTSYPMGTEGQAARA